MPYIATIDILVDCANEDEAILTVHSLMVRKPKTIRAWCWLEDQEPAIAIIKTEPIPKDFRPTSPWPSTID